MCADVTLESLARVRFKDLTPTEVKVLQAAPIGEIAVCGPNMDDDDPLNDPGETEEWGQERFIRADLVRWICVDLHARELVDPRGIRVYGAKISEVLDISCATVPFGLGLWHCRLTGQTNLCDCEIAELDFRGSRVDSVVADRLKVKGSVFLHRGFRSAGGVRLLGAQIGGDLACRGSTFANPPRSGEPDSGRALSADRAVVKGSVFLSEGFAAMGEVRLLGAQIGSILNCRAGTFDNPPEPGLAGSGRALSADRAVVKGTVFLSNGFLAKGQVHLLGAQIGSDLNCRAGTFENPPQPGSAESGKALSAGRCVINGTVFLNGSFKGEVNLLGAQIAGDLNCRGASIVNPLQPAVAGSGRAFSVDRAFIKGSVFLSQGFRAMGEVRLLDTQIGSVLNCRSGTFKSPPEPGVADSGKAFSADRAVIKGTVFLNGAFAAKGEVRFPGAQIGSDLNCRGATMENPLQAGVADSGRALTADRAVVKGSVFLDRTFKAKGRVSLLGIAIGNNLDCTGASFENSPPPGTSETTGALIADRAVVGGNTYFGRGFSARGHVRLSGAQIGGNLTCDNATFSGILSLQSCSINRVLRWLDIVDSVGVRLDLVNASVDALVDTPDSWPARGNLKLDGFEYGRFSAGAPKDARSRLDWLARQNEFTPQPYRQLAKVLTEEGDNFGARRILSRMELLRRKLEGRDYGRIAKWWSGTKSLVLRGTVGYGYNPGRALVWLLLLVGTGWPLYRAGYFAGQMAPTDEKAYRHFKNDNRPPAYYEPFQAVIYSFECAFPLVKLGQADRWQPDPAFFHSSSTPATLVSAKFLLRFRWAQTLLGWFFATMGLAAVTGIVRKD